MIMMMMTDFYLIVYCFFFDLMLTIKQIETVTIEIIIGVMLI